METFTLLRVGIVHTVGQCRGNGFQKRGIFYRRSLYEERNLLKIYLPLLAESLHGIEHTVMRDMSFPDIHRDATCRMHHQCLFPLTFDNALKKFGKGGIFQ